MGKSQHLFPSFCAGLVACAALFVGPVRAVQAEASAWVGDPRGEVRLITAANSVHGKTLQAGLEFRYPPGWHGYWRTPGDTGIAPTLDWAASVNLRSAAIAWPAPSRLVVSGLQNGVYTGDVVLPLLLQVDEANTQTRLSVALDYASCSNVCVPLHADLSLVLPGGPGGASAEADAIAKAWTLVPGTPSAAGIEILRNALLGSGQHRRLLVQLHSDTLPFLAPDLFVEGAGNGLPPAPVVQRSHHGQDVELAVALPSSGAAVRSTPLRLTIVDGTRAAEFSGPAAAGNAVSAANRSP
ncbi:protein-disulfide reductase DsbD domain-containing protein [Paraburkholderia sp. J12]|uniref:protein-disulfide reductase DsbD domain-containing protein n=1 Tax=Paraburkholderia sp. J12 TaxID=2805432 RepID=UPI002ABE94B3|nr:protein-disulfide reductase DsbD domain-containing protein [Paraburkholderia sp. J12]